MMHTSISHKWPMQLFQKLTQGLPQKVLLLLLVQDLFNRLQDFSKKLSKMLIQGLFKKLQILFKRLIHNVFRSCSKALQGLLRVIPSTSLDITGLRSLHWSMFWFGAQNIEPICTIALIPHSVPLFIIYSIVHTDTYFGLASTEHGQFS